MADFSLLAWISHFWPLFQRISHFSCQPHSHASRPTPTLAGPLCVASWPTPTPALPMTWFLLLPCFDGQARTGRSPVDMPACEKWEIQCEKWEICAIAQEKWQIQSEKWEINAISQEKWEIQVKSEKFERRKSEKFEPKVRNSGCGTILSEKFEP